MVSCLQPFFKHVPKNELARDKKGRYVLFIYGYDFDENNVNAINYEDFGSGLLEAISTLYVEPVSNIAVYWTSKNAPLEEYLFQHFSENFIPMQFVLDTPQSQFGHDSVTWNFGYDNEGVAKRDNLLRVIRNDKQYIEEMWWLAKYTNPSIVFIYGWNEPFEGSLVIPTEKWGSTKSKLCKEMINSLQISDSEMLSTIIITDDLSDGYGKQDWHYSIEEGMLLYSMRRFAPQADTITVKEVSKDKLLKYDVILDISTYKDSNLVSILKEMKPSKKIMTFDPLCGYRPDNNTASMFGTPGMQLSINDDESVFTDGKGLEVATILRDDLNDILLNKNSDCQNAYVKYQEKAYPIVISNGDDIFVNAYNDDENILGEAFERLYDKEISESIMFGEGLASQRIEVDTSGKVVLNRLEKKSAIGRVEIPEDINWFVEVDGVDLNTWPEVFEH